MAQTPQERPPKSEQDKPVPVIWIDATKERYQAGLHNFSNVEERITNSPESKDLVGQAYTDGDVVLRGFHRFTEKPEDFQLILDSLQQTGIDRTLDISRGGEMLHIIASFVHDRWPLVLPYTMEDLHIALPKKAQRSYGVILVFDNQDGAICYMDYSENKVYGKNQPLPKKVHMTYRDEQMGVMIATSQTRQVPQWEQRLKSIIVIEYPLLERPEKDDLFNKLKRIFK